MNRIALGYIGLLWAVVILAGCGDGSSADRPQVVVFAAASTGEAVDEIGAAAFQKHGIRLKASYAGTSTLAQQVAHGAGAEVFLSANENWADYLEEKGLVAQRRDLLGNRLVIVVPADSPVVLREPKDLLDPQIRNLALADPVAVPAGVYARQALEKLGLWQQLESKVVAGADVQHVRSFVELGAAEAGIVYATDAAASDEIRVSIELPTELTEPIQYPVLLLKQGAKNPAAEAFYRFLCGPEAASIFRQRGFQTLP